MKQHVSKTRQELLDNTIKHFNSKNRASAGLQCAYTTSDGRACAIGIEVKPSLREKLEYDCGGGEVIQPKIHLKLPKRLQNMGKDFLMNIQNLHDVGDYWNEKGLTPNGERAVAVIKDEFNLK